jgi:hypothetical protein
MFCEDCELDLGVRLKAQAMLEIVHTPRNGPWSGSQTAAAVTNVT